MFGRNLDRVAEARAHRLPSRRYRRACPRSCWRPAPPACWRGVRNRRRRGRSASNLRARRSRTSAHRPAPIAVSVCSCIRAVSEPLAPSSRPAVSIDGEFEIAEASLALTTIAGDAGFVIDQRQLLSDQTVEQRRFSDIGPADNGNGEEDISDPCALRAHLASCSGFVSQSAWQQWRTYPQSSHASRLIGLPRPQSR